MLLYRLSSDGQTLENRWTIRSDSCRLRSVSVATEYAVHHDVGCHDAGNQRVASFECLDNHDGEEFVLFTVRLSITKIYVTGYALRGG